MRIFLFFIFLAFSINASSITKTEGIYPTKQELIEIEESKDEFSDDFSDDFSKNDEKEVFDPFSGYNRHMTTFNDYLFINILTPVATGYSYVLPQPVRKSIDNVFENLFFPIRFTNNLLQLKFKNTLEETGRFVINSTIGILGIFDVASDFGLEAHHEDFGQTLGFYGVGAGPHLVLPIFGPSNLRDALSKIPDSYLDPTNSNTYDLEKYIATDVWSIVLMRSVYYTNKTSLHLGEYENLKKDAIDLYPFLRDIYEQKRLKEIQE